MRRGGAGYRPYGHWRRGRYNRASKPLPRSWLDAQQNRARRSGIALADGHQSPCPSTQYGAHDPPGEGKLKGAGMLARCRGSRKRLNIAYEACHEPRWRERRPPFLDQRRWRWVRPKAHPLGAGLQNMADRLDALGGSLTITAAP